MTTAAQAGRIPQWTTADRLRKARDHAGLSQADLADAMGVSRNSVSSYETGVVQPRRIVLNAWALTTGVPLSWLMTGDDNGGCAIGDSNAEPADLESSVTLLDVHYTDGWFVTEWPTIPIAA